MERGEKDLLGTETMGCSECPWCGRPCTTPLFPGTEHCQVPKVISVLNAHHLILCASHIQISFHGPTGGWNTEQWRPEPGATGRCSGNTAQVTGFQRAVLFTEPISERGPPRAHCQHSRNKELLLIFLSKRQIKFKNVQYNFWKGPVHLRVESHMEEKQVLRVSCFHSFIHSFVLLFIYLFISPEIDFISVELIHYI
jgi:hypothetical protein